MDWGPQFLFWGEHGVLLGVWVSLAVSLNLINGCAGLFSLGHQGFWAVGAYVAALFVPLAGAGEPAPGLGLFLLSFPAAMLAAALFGFLAGLPCLRMRGDYLAIATLAFSEIFRNLANNSEFLGKAQGLQVHNVVRGLMVSAFGDTAGARVAVLVFFLLLSWGVALLSLVLLHNLMRSGHGRAIQAIRDDETAAELLGVNLTRYKVFVFVLGAGLAGLAGAVYAHFQRYVSPGQFNFMQGVTLVIIVVLGGMGSFTGTILAACGVYLIPVLLTFAPADWTVPIFYDPTQEDPWVRRSPQELWQVLFAVLLIVIILVRPQGLMGRAEWSLPALWRRLRGRRAAQGGRGG